MNRWLTSVASKVKKLGKGMSVPRPRRARLGVESLEARELLSTTPITDMTQWVQQFPAPTHA
jgi:hypothetical protein